MTRPIQIKKMMPQDAEDYLKHLRRKLDNGQIESTNFLRQAEILNQVDNCFYWQCLKCGSLVLINHSDISGIIFCINCGTVYEDGFLYPKEANFPSLDNVEMPPQPNTPFDYYREIQVGELCPYCGEKSIEKGYSAKKKCPDQECAFWKYHNADFEHNERKKPFNYYKDIKADEVCPYCKKEKIEIGSWGGKMCPDKQCRYWQYHKDDFDHNESENAYSVAMDWLYD